MKLRIAFDREMETSQQEFVSALARSIDKAFGPEGELHQDGRLFDDGHTVVADVSIPEGFLDTEIVSRLEREIDRAVVSDVRPVGGAILLRATLV